MPDIPLAVSLQVNDVPRMLPDESKYVVSLSESENFFTDIFVFAGVESKSAEGIPVVSDIFGRAEVSVSTLVTSQLAP